MIRWDAPKSTQNQQTGTEVAKSQQSTQNTEGTQELSEKQGEEEKKEESKQALGKEFNEEKVEEKKTREAKKAIEAEKSKIEKIIMDQHDHGDEEDDIDDYISKLEQ